MDFTLDPSLVLYLPLYELDGASLMSKDKHGHLATVTGALWTPQGRSFDGVDDKITTPHSSAFDFGTSDFTLASWVKITDTGIANNLLYKSSDSPYYGFGLHIWGGTAQLTIGLGTTSIGQYDSGVTVNDGNPHNLMVGVRRSTDQALFYIDGLLRATVSIASSSGVTVDNTAVLNIGSGNPWGQKLTGTIGELGASNRLLTALEMLNIYLATKWRYQ